MFMQPECVTSENKQPSLQLMTFSTKSEVDEDLDDSTTPARPTVLLARNWHDIILPINYSDITAHSKLGRASLAMIADGAAAS